MKTLFWDAINPETGTPYTWDDPNIRWGDPSYVLEPGDPGYTPPEPPSPASSAKPKTTKKMLHQSYYPTRSADQLVWLENFRNKLPTYAATLGLDAARVTATVADAHWLGYVLGTFIPAVRAFSAACTQAGNQAQYGTGGTLVLPVFTPPPLEDATPRPEGALERIFDLVGEINENNACTPAMCADLRIVGPEAGPPDWATFRPAMKVAVTAAGVFLGWGWQGFSRFLDQLEIQVDRADGKGWQILTFDTTPDYTDTAPKPAALTQWKYRAIFRVDDAPIGQWSEVYTVTVGG